MKRRISISLLAAAFLIAGFLFLTGDRAEAAEGKWKHNKTGWWYEYPDGSYATGWLKWEGKWYYFLSSGYMETSGYRQGYWIGKNGAVNMKYAGGRWRKDKNGWWFRDQTGWYPRKQWLKINGTEYYFDVEGYLATNQWIGQYCVTEEGVWDPDASTDWAQEYMNDIEVFQAVSLELWGDSYQPEYSLIYLDEDSTPELVLHVGDYQTQTEVRTFVSDRTLTCECNSGSIVYESRKGLFKDDTMIGDKRTVVVYQLKDNAFLTLGSGTEVVPRQEGEYAIFSWNGETVSEEEFRDSILQVYPEESTHLMITYVSYDKIRETLYKITRKKG